MTADAKKQAEENPTADALDPEKKKNVGESETKVYAWPRYVFKRGTGRLVDETKGRYEAETRLVHDEDELARLGDGWLNTPREAAMGTNVTNANANVTFNEDGTVVVEPKSSVEGQVDRTSDIQRRTLIDADDSPKPRLDR